MWDFWFFFNSALLGIGLAMDAFSVSLANGMNHSNMDKKLMLGVSGTFGFFQGLMPLIGWLCVRTIANLFEDFQKLIPWIALILLVFIGGKMLLEGIKNKDEENTEVTKLTFAAILIQGIATSIDALSVGFTISDYDFVHALVCSIIIMGITFGLCYIGIILGKKFGTKFADKAAILGGIILIVIGIEIFLTGIL
jgi:putative Mn2+ efflux pump MntP